MYFIAAVVWNDTEPVVFAATSPVVYREITGSATPPLTGRGEETLTLPLHASLNFLARATEADAVLDLTP